MIVANLLPAIFIFCILKSATFYFFKSDILHTWYLLAFQQVETKTIFFQSSSLLGESIGLKKKIGYLCRKQCYDEQF